MMHIKFDSTIVQVLIFFLATTKFSVFTILYLCIDSTKVLQIYALNEWSRNVCTCAYSMHQCN